MKKGYWLFILGAIPIASLAILSTLNQSNLAETSGNNVDTKLRTRRYKTDLQNFVAETEKVLPTVSTYGQNWRLITTDADENSAQIEVEVSVVFFTDDLKIKANFIEGEVSVDVRSASRIGTSDLGENRRHILKLLEILDEKFSR